MPKKRVATKSDGSMNMRINAKRTALVKKTTLAVSTTNGEMIRTSQFVGYLIDNFSGQAYKKMTSKNK